MGQSVTKSLLTVFLIDTIDGEVEQEQVEVPKGDLADEGHDEAGQEEAAQGKLHPVSGP